MVDAEPAPTATNDEPVIASTGAWLKLGDDIFESETFERQGNSFVRIVVESQSAEDDAALSRLRPSEQGFPLVTLSFAHQNEGGFMSIKDVTSTSKGDGNIWSIVGEIDEPDSGFWMEATHNFDGKQLTPDDLAEMKAGRLLINDPAPPKRRNRGFGHDHLESLVGGETKRGVRTDACVVRNVVNSHGADISMALVRARLESVFVLKAASIVESILKLTLRPENDHIEVEFEGRRPR